MLKNIITADTYNAYPADSPLRAEYKLSGSDYVLQHDEDTGALKRSKDHEKSRADGLAVELSNERNAHAVTKAAATSKDSPLKIAEDAKAAALKEVEPKLKRAETLETRLKTQELSKTATDLAAKIGGEKNKIALLPHIERRLEVRLNDKDEPQVIIKAADGKDTTLKVEDLEKEIRGNKDLATLVIVSAANGGAGRQPQPGAPGIKQSPASSAGEKGIGDMNPDERKAYIQEKYVGAAATA
jgi:hypothetical protein